MKNSRTNNSLKNSIVSIVYNCATILITFVAQSIFIKTLGAEYNGVKSLFQNILSMLSVVELGFGTAIVYNLYKPISENNENQIKIIVKFYKNIYRLIAIIIFILGLILMFFIPYIVGDTNISDNIYLIFVLYLLNSVLSYLLSYKRSILYADQKNYIINIIEIVFNVLKCVLQILVLLITKNFIIYLLVQIVTTILNNIVISIVANKKYPYLKNLKNCENIDSDLKADIKHSVKGLLFHKIGSFFVTGTDNILISLSDNLGIVYVGYYANYNMIISNVALIFGTMISSVTASVGNLLAVKGKNILRTYKSMLLINSWVYCFGMISIYCLSQTFIEIWIGREYLLSNFILCVLVINFYINGIKRTSNTFKEAAGVFYKDRFIPLIESAVNIVCSLIFMHYFGLAGVFIGTICSSLVLLCYSYPKYVFLGILNQNYKDYYKLYGRHLFITIVAFIITAYINSFVNFDIKLVELIIRAFICIIIPNLIYLLMNYKTDDFEYIKGLLKNKIKSLRKSKK